MTHDELMTALFVVVFMLSVWGLLTLIDRFLGPKKG